MAGISAVAESWTAGRSQMPENTTSVRAEYRGIFDCDGCTPRSSIQMKSAKLIHRAAELEILHGIDSTVYSASSSPSWRIPTRASDADEHIGALDKPARRASMLDVNIHDADDNDGGHPATKPASSFQTYNYWPERPKTSSCRCFYAGVPGRSARRAK